MAKFNHAYMEEPPVDNHPGGGKLMTDQSFKKQCDVNVIMSKFQRQGVLDHVKKYEGNYGDFVSVPTLHECMNIVASANDMFSTLPSEVREHFRNDPGEFLDAVQDADRRDELVQLKLLAPDEPTAEPVEPRAAEPPNDGGAAAVPTPETEA